MSSTGLARSPASAGASLGSVGVEVLKSQLASVGISQHILSAFEKELNREGLSLGALGKPSPMAGLLSTR